MAKVRIPVGSMGAVNVVRLGSGWQAQVRVRGYDGVLRRVKRSGRTKADAYVALVRAVAEGAGAAKPAPKADAEERVTNPVTGAEKGSKIERYDLIPVGPLAELARLYGVGARKYATHNWAKGYDWSLSYAALQRHANAWWGGQEVDPETGVSHMAAVAWHAFALMHFAEAHRELDDRFSTSRPGAPTPKELGNSIAPHAPVNIHKERH